MRVAAVALLLLAGCAAESRVRSVGAAPNFVVFIADDLGYGDLGCYGHPILKTPNIDRIAREGVRFDRAFLTTSSCSPSRASILTGRYPHSTGAEDLHRPLAAEQVTLARLLRGAGYHRVAVGKWHLGPHEGAMWDRVFECKAGEFGDRAVSALQERPREAPFFAWMASHDPHRPFGDAPPLHDPAAVALPPYLPDHPLIRKEIAQYYDEIARLDRHVGEVMSELERQGVLENTVVAFLSDNGMPFPRAKTTLYDSGLRTPLLIRGPGVSRGIVQKGLVSGVDLAPTLLEPTGMEPKAMQGRSFRPMLRQAAAPGREAIFAEANWHDYDQFSRAVRTESFLLVRNYYWDKPLWNSVDSINSVTWKGFMEMEEAGTLTPAQRFLLQAPRPFEEFYDLRKDPHSLVNVADDPKYRDPLNTLRTMLDEWRIETNDRMPETRTPEGWTRDGIPLPHNQPWYDRYLKEGKSSFDR